MFDAFFFFSFCLDIDYEMLIITIILNIKSISYIKNWLAENKIIEVFFWPLKKRKLTARKQIKYLIKHRK